MRARAGSGSQPEVLLDRGHLAEALQAVLSAMRGKLVTGDLYPHPEKDGNVDGDPLAPEALSLSSWVQLARTVTRIQQWCATSA